MGATSPIAVQNSLASPEIPSLGACPTEPSRLFGHPGAGEARQGTGCLGQGAVPPTTPGSRIMS